MDAGIADTINRRDVLLIAARLDALDLPRYGATDTPWYLAPLADTLMDETDKTRGDRAWLIGALGANIPGVAFDGEPAGGDWDNLYAHVRAAIEARRDPQTPPARAAGDLLVGVV